MSHNRFTRLHLAWVLAAPSIALAVAGSWNPFDLVFALCVVATLAAAHRRRWRFASAVALGVWSCEQLVALADHHGSVWSAAAALCAASAVVVLLWPCFEAAKQDAPLPPLPGSWALVSTLLVSAVGGVLLFTCPGELAVDDRSGLLLCGFSGLILFAGLMLASQLGPLRWPAQLFFGAVSILCGGGAPFDHLELSTVQRAAQAAPVVAFVLGFDWIRSGRSSGERALRAGVLVAALGLAPSVIAAPHQAFALVALARLLAWSLAFGIAAGLAPRVTGQPREGAYYWRPVLPSVWRTLPLLAAVALLPWLAIVPATIRFGAAGSLVVAFAIALPVFLVATLMRFRFVRAFLWAAITLPLVVVGLQGGFFMFLSTAVAAAVAALLSAPKVSGHFRRRVRLVLTPHPLASLGLGGAAAAALLAFIGWQTTPQNRGELLAQLDGPVMLHGALLYAPPTPEASPDDPPKAGAVVVDPLGRGTWVVDEENDAVVLVTVSGEQHVIRVGAWPQQLVVDAKGLVYVSCREAGRVDVIDPFFKVSSIALPGEPRGLALDATQLYVGLVTGRELVSVDLSTREVVARRALDVAPYELAVSHEQLAALPRLGGSLMLASLDLKDLHAEPLPMTGRQAWHGQALVPAGDDLLVVYDGVDTGLEGAAVGDSDGYGGTVHTPVELHVAMLHRGHFIVSPPHLEEQVAHGGSDITGAVLEGGTLELVSRGTQELIGIPLHDGLFGRFTQLPLGDGAVGLASDGRGLVSFAAFDRKLVRLGQATRDETRLSASKLDRELARGRSLFFRSNNFAVSNAGLSCATCHPDGREDGLVWRLKGSRVQTPMLAAKIAETAPYNWHGSSPTLEANIAQTVERLGGRGLSDDERSALARYLRKGLHAPARAEAKDAPLVALGRSVFERPSVGCADCHTTDGTFTDGARHDVGSLSATERDELTNAHSKERTPALFDTPSLIGVGLTAPYFHDGSAPTLEALVAQNGERMGHTSQLSQREKDALVAYLKTL